MAGIGNGPCPHSFTSGCPYCAIHGGYGGGGGPIGQQFNRDSGGSWWIKQTPGPYYGGGPVGRDEMEAIALLEVLKEKAMPPDFYQQKGIPMPIDISTKKTWLVYGDNGFISKPVPEDEARAIAKQQAKQNEKNVFGLYACIAVFETEDKPVVERKLE